MPTFSYSISSLPFYDTRQQQYTKILCVNAAPTGPLAHRVQVVRPPRLSPFQQPQAGVQARCVHALITAADCPLRYMSPDDLPELFAFLATNGYTVDTGLTKLAAKHQSSDAGSLVCIVSYT
jgi:hypothetical protein